MLLHVSVVHSFLLINGTHYMDKLKLSLFLLLDIDCYEHSFY